MPTDAQQDTIVIRRAADADLPRVEHLLCTNDLPTDGVADAFADFVVAQTSNDIVGVAGIEYRGAYGLLRSTAVAAEARGNGIARQLVERIIADAKARDLRALYLLTTTAERYFPSFGFEQIGRDAAPDEIRATGEFQGACPASATVMRLDLSR